MSRISLAQLAGSVRTFNLNRPFICPIFIKGCLQSTVCTRLVAKVAFILLILQKTEDWNSLAVVDGLIITGQNPGSSTAVAEALLQTVNRN